MKYPVLRVFFDGLTRYDPEVNNQIEITNKNKVARLAFWGYIGEPLKNKRRRGRKPKAAPERQ